MKQGFRDRYICFGGIEKVFESYKNGTLTIEGISDKVNVSQNIVRRNLKSAFGVDALEKAQARWRHEISKEKRIRDINAGKSGELSYDEAITCLDNGKIKRKGFISVFETVMDLAHPITGEPKLVWFGSHTLRKIDGNNGSVMVRYAAPTKESLEYRVNRYRFKITPNLAREVTAGIFCIKAQGRCSYYLVPSKSLVEIQSLNLKFDKYDGSKYSDFLVKVEELK